MHIQALPAVALATSLLASTAQAQTAEVYLQGARQFGAGNTIYLYGLPVKNAAGDTVSYWDAQVLVEAAADTGRPNKVSFTSVVKSPKLKKTEFQIGTYKDINSTATCSLTASPFNGRNEYSLDCVNTNGTHNFTALWFPGPIAGHPYEPELLAAKLDTIPGSAEYSWGKTVFNDGIYWFGCFLTPHLLSARQIGNVITLINWGNDTAENCRMTFHKQ